MSKDRGWQEWTPDRAVARARRQGMDIVKDCRIIRGNAHTAGTPEIEDLPESGMPVGIL
jgi:hypothetical protein